MKPEQDGSKEITFHSFNCLSEECSFTVYFDTPPFKEVSEYNIQFYFNDKHYCFDSSTSEWAEYATHVPVTHIRENSVDIIELDYYVPFQHDLNYYINFITRIMNLKAFL